MWIRTQDKKELVNVIKVEISRIFGAENNKAIIWGRFAPSSLFSSNRVYLASYPTVNEAINELNEIEKNIIENPNGVYHMKSNKRLK